MPPPSRTTDADVLTTLAVCSIAMVTGPGPQSKVISPPRATARTTARDVQDAGVPLPTTVAAALSSVEVRAARASRPLAPTGVADAATLDAIAAELSKDRTVTHEHGVVRSHDDMGFALAFQVSVRRPLDLPAETVNAPGAPVQRPANTVAVDQNAPALPRSLSHVAQVAEGAAVCVVAGQQPGPLGGPLYTWHKVHTAVALARVLCEEIHRLWSAVV